MAGGRPTDYKPEYCDLVFKLCLLGATDEEMADVLGVATSTFYKWKKEIPAFSEAINNGKVKADAEVAEKLRNRALGYSCEEEKVVIIDGQPQIIKTTKHYPPDATSAIFWLKNRKSDKWREKQEVKIEEEISEESLPDFARKLAFFLQAGDNT